LSKPLVRELIDAGVQFGHRVSRWNPKMAPYILGKRGLVHIIDIKETLKGLLRAKKLLAQVVASGKDVLFVGTKRQAREIIIKQAARCGMHYVSERWLGGTLTNFRTIRSRLARLEELEALDASGAMSGYSKKMESTLKRERRKIQRNLEGIRRMSRLPGVLVVVDVRREHIAVKEARKLGIPTVCLIDTDGDPDLVDLVIPGNDDAMRAIEVIISQLADAVMEGTAARTEAPPEEEAPRPARRRSSRAAPRAEPEEAPAVGEAAEPVGAGAAAGAPSTESAGAGGSGESFPSGPDPAEQGSAQAPQAGSESDANTR
jgi:small subunit ribosomal protein S2